MTLDFDRERKWLAALKTGDSVAKPAGFSGHMLDKVHHCTATQIHIRGTKYSRKNGKRMGSDSWSRDWIYEPTQDILDEIEEGKIRWRVSEIKWKEQPLDVLRKVLELTSPTDSAGV